MANAGRAGDGINDPSVIGPVESADLVATLKLNVDELIYLLPPLDTPMLTGEGSDGLSLISQMPVDQTSFISYTESFLAPNSTLAGTVTNVATTFDVSPAGDGAKFQAGDLLSVHIVGAADPEIMHVKSVSGDTLTVDRGGTQPAQGTAASYTAGDVVVITGSAQPEGSVAPDARAHGRRELQHYTQIFGPTKIDMTETAQVVSKYGVPDEWARQLMFRIKENAQQREHAYVMGVPFYNNDTAADLTRGSASLNSEITTNVSASVDLDVPAIEAVQALCYDEGGIPDRMMANPKILGKLNLTSDENRVRQDMADSRRGRIPTMTVWTEFGPLEIARNRWCPISHAFGFNRDGVTRRVLRPLQYVRLAKVGDSDQAHIVCEEGLQVKGEEHMFKFDQLAIA